VPPSGQSQSGYVGVTLALSGGFSRGFAHLGVLEVLEKEAIPVAAIAGTGIGSLLGAAYADGFSTRELLKLGRHMQISDPFWEFSSRPGPDNGHMAYVDHWVGEWLATRRIEELAIPTAIVATDLHTFAPYVFHRGPLEVALRASCAFPGLFRPVEYQGRMLAAGSLAAQVPTDVAARMNGDCVVAVVVSITGNTSASKTDFGAPNRVSPVWARRADLILEPDVDQIVWNDFSRIREASAAGADAMRHALPCVRTLLAKQRDLRASALLRSASHWAS
jgi:NTE family protein